MKEHNLLISSPHTHTLEGWERRHGRERDRDQANLFSSRIAWLQLHEMLKLLRSALCSGLSTWGQLRSHFPLQMPPSQHQRIEALVKAHEDFLSVGQLQPGTSS